MRPNRRKAAVPKEKTEDFIRDTCAKPFSRLWGIALKFADRIDLLQIAEECSARFYSYRRAARKLSYDLVINQELF